MIYQSKLFAFSFIWFKMFPFISDCNKKISLHFFIFQNRKFLSLFSGIEITLSSKQSRLTLKLIIRWMYTISKVNLLDIIRIAYLSEQAVRGRLIVLLANISRCILITARLWYVLPLTKTTNWLVTRRWTKDGSMHITNVLCASMSATDTID